MEVTRSAAAVLFTPDRHLPCLAVGRIAAERVLPGETAGCHEIDMSPRFPRWQSVSAGWPEGKQRNPFGDLGAFGQHELLLEFG